MQNTAPWRIVFVEYNLRPHNQPSQCTHKYRDRKNWQLFVPAFTHSRLYTNPGPDRNFAKVIPGSNLFMNIWKNNVQKSTWTETTSKVAIKSAKQASEDGRNLFLFVNIALLHSKQRSIHSFAAGGAFYSEYNSSKNGCDNVNLYSNYGNGNEHHCCTRSAGTVN